MWNWVNPASHVLVVGYQVTSSFTHNQTPISALVHACAVACLGFVVWVISNKAPSLWAQNDFRGNPFKHDWTNLSRRNQKKSSSGFRKPELRHPGQGWWVHNPSGQDQFSEGQDTLQLSFRGYSWIFMDIHGYSVIFTISSSAGLCLSTTSQQRSTRYDPNISKNITGPQCFFMIFISWL